MHFRAPTTSKSLHRHLLVILIPLALGGAGANFACSADSAVPNATTLRSRFPQKAAQILDVGYAFLPTTRGFTAPATRSANAGFVMNLPATAEDGIVVGTREGREIVVRERGISGAGKSDSNAVVYTREGGSSYWTANDEGYEEWLLLNEMATVGAGPVAFWDIEGADLRQDGTGVDLVGANGEIRVHVTAPAAFAGDGRSVPVRLVANGQTILLFADIEGEAVLVDPVWTSPPSMMTARRNHTATLLQNGKVLIVGGSSTNNTLNTAELYDPATNSFSAAASMTDVRDFHTATLLQDGRVLVAGGFSGNNFSLKYAEIYNPVTNTWTNTPTMSIPHARHAADILPNGQVVVVGGESTNGKTQQLERYDPATNTWSLAGSLTLGRMDLAATALPNGKLLVTGGVSPPPNYVSNADLCDPMMGTCSVLPVMDSNRALHTSSLLDNGKVLIAGGLSDAASPVASTQLFDPATNLWQPASSLAVARGLHKAARLPNGMILVAGGNLGGATATAGAEIYDPLANTWSTTVSMLGARFWHTSTTLQSGKVLVTGGTNAGVVTATTQLFDYPDVNGTTCTSNGSCASGFCVDGVCCDSACNAGPCDACSVATGASTNGTCMLLTGNPCNDGNACTQLDTCQAGACTGTNDVVCASLDDCHEAGTCDMQSGTCSDPAKPDNSPCSGGTCLAGACVPSGSGGAGGNGGAAGSGGSGGSSGSGGAGAGGSGGEVSSSSSASGGGQEPTADEGCSCNAVGRSPSEPANWLMVFLMAVALRRRPRSDEGRRVARVHHFGV